MGTPLTLACSLPSPAVAQGDSISVRAGAHYQAGDTERFLLGSKYRDLWTTPIRVPVLDPDTFAGGLTLLRRGSGLQTASLRFQAADGSEYVFRSVDKDQSGGLPEDLHDTVISQLVQDQVSSKHPAAALVVAPLLEAAGVLHPSPRLAVMADHPVLGEHREEFAGMLGMIEDRPEEAEEGAGFGGFDRITGTEALLERIEDSPGDRVDAEAYLRARLMDLLVGDWDRHPDQWRWAEEERAGIRYWIPIPRDRDNAFSHYDGLIGTLGSALRPNVQRFEGRYTNLYGLIHNAQLLDRRILPVLPRSTWDAIAADLQRRISDQVIREAVSRMPPEYVALGGDELAAKLSARRDALPEVARSFYALLSIEPDVRATDEDDVADVERFTDGSVRVRLSAASSGEPYFDRTFVPEETQEVRIYLHGGADRLTVRGRGGGITVRGIGGGGDDLLEDASIAGRGAVTALYDHRGTNEFRSAGGTRIDERPYDTAEAATAAENNAPPLRDWGSERSAFTPSAEWRSNIGPVIGGGPTWTRYGFRRLPYATRSSVAVEYAPLHARLGFVGELRRIHIGGVGETLLRARASQVSATRFHGLGNETPRGPDSDLYLLWATEYTLTGELTRILGDGLLVSGGAQVSHLDPTPHSGSPVALAALPGGRSYGLAGLFARAAVARTDTIGYPRSGFTLRTHAEGFPLTWGSAEEAFGRGGAVATAYLPVAERFDGSLALRVGGEKVWGDAPLQRLAFIGGGGSLRGHYTQRFAGEAALHGSAELRTRLGRANLLLAHAEVGTIAFLDAGRVFVSSEASDRVHTGYGGGVWLGTLNRALTGHLLLGIGEKPSLHAGFGLPF